MNKKIISSYISRSLNSFYAALILSLTATTSFAMDCVPSAYTVTNTTASNEEYLKALNDNPQSLLTLAENLVKKGISVTKRKNFGKTLLNVAQELHQRNLAVIKTVPASLSVCP